MAQAPGLHETQLAHRVHRDDDLGKISQMRQQRGRSVRTGQEDPPGRKARRQGGCQFARRGHVRAETAFGQNAAQPERGVRFQGIENLDFRRQMRPQLGHLGANAAHVISERRRAVTLDDFAQDFRRVNGSGRFDEQGGGRVRIDRTRLDMRFRSVCRLRVGVR